MAQQDSDNDRAEREETLSIDTLLKEPTDGPVSFDPAARTLFTSSLKDGTDVKIEDVGTTLNVMFGGHEGVVFEIELADLVRAGWENAASKGLLATEKEMREQQEEEERGPTSSYWDLYKSIEEGDRVLVAYYTATSAYDEVKLLEGKVRSAQSEWITIDSDDGDEYSIMGRGLADRSEGDIKRESTNRKIGEFRDFKVLSDEE